MIALLREHSPNLKDMLDSVGNDINWWKCHSANLILSKMGQPSLLSGFIIAKLFTILNTTTILDNRLGISVSCCQELSSLLGLSQQWEGVQGRFGNAMSLGYVQSGLVTTVPMVCRYNVQFGQSDRFLLFENCHR